VARCKGAADSSLEATTDERLLVEGGSRVLSDERVSQR
jgi:hypothetical protein